MKIWLFLAITVITGHNVIAHDHLHSQLSAHHPGDNDNDHDDHDKHNLFALNLIDHSFITESSTHLDHTLANVDITSHFDQVSLPAVICYLIPKSKYQIQQESPPLQQHYSFSALRAPPYIII